MSISIVVGTRPETVRVRPAPPFPHHKTACLLPCFGALQGSRDFQFVILPFKLSSDVIDPLARESEGWVDENATL